MARDSSNAGEEGTPSKTDLVTLVLQTPAIRIPVPLPHSHDMSWAVGSALGCSVVGVERELRVGCPLSLCPNIESLTGQMERRPWATTWVVSSDVLVMEDSETTWARASARSH